MKHWHKSLFSLFLVIVIIILISAFNLDSNTFFNQIFLPLVLRDKQPSTPTPTVTQTPIPTSTPTRTQTLITTFTPTSKSTLIPTATKNCHYSYPTVCIPPPPPDLDCGDIPYRNFIVLPPNPHRFDGDGDGIGCESW